MISKSYSMRILLIIMWLGTIVPLIACDTPETLNPIQNRNPVAELPGELLENIAENLDLVDMIRFGETSATNHKLIVPFFYHTYWRCRVDQELKYDFESDFSVKKFTWDTKNFGCYKKLRVWVSGLEAKAAESLLPLFQNVNSVKIALSEIPLNFFKPFTESIHLALLQELHLVMLKLDHRHLDCLIQATFIDNLKKLSISCCNLTLENFATVFSANMANLENLSLSHTIMDAQGAEILVASDVFCRLRVLNLAGNNIGDKGLLAIINSQLIPQIESIDLRGNDITYPMVQTFLDSNKFPKLTNYFFEEYTVNDGTLNVLFSSREAESHLH